MRDLLWESYGAVLGRDLRTSFLSFTPRGEEPKLLEFLEEWRLRDFSLLILIKRIRYAGDNDDMNTALH